MNTEALLYAIVGLMIGLAIRDTWIADLGSMLIVLAAVVTSCVLAYAFIRYRIFDR